MRTIKLIRTFFLTSLTLGTAAIGCRSKTEIKTYTISKAEPDFGAPSTQSCINYSTHISPAMGQCTSCHSTQGTSTKPYLSTYAEVSAAINAVITSMQNNRMPPSGATTQSASLLSNLIKFNQDGLKQSEFNCNSDL